MSKKRWDTSLGGARKLFPETTMGLLGRLGPGDEENRRTTIEELCNRYWKPIYSYLRIARPKSNEEAKDLTQSFFLWLMQGSVLDRYDSEQGSFRNYLKMLLRRFVRDEYKTANRLKRGGGIQIFKIEANEQAWDEALIDPGETDPDHALDQAWRNLLVKGAVETVQEDYLAAGNKSDFQIFEAREFYTEEEKPTYKEVADRYGVTVSSVRETLRKIRSDIRSALRKELERSTTGTKELEDEWNALFGS